MFLTEERKYVNTGGYQKQRWIRTAPHPMPIDPTPVFEGNVAVYKYPGDVPGSGLSIELLNMERPANFYYRRITGYALEWLQRWCKQRGKAQLYTIHFDTCPGQRRGRYV